MTLLGSGAGFSMGVAGPSAIPAVDMSLGEFPNAECMLLCRWNLQLVGVREGTIYDSRKKTVTVTPGIEGIVGKRQSFM